MPRRRRSGLITVGAGFVALLVLPLGLVLFPPSPQLGAADAVVVHAGAGGRLHAAERLAAAGLAPRLVISRGEYEGRPVQDPDPLCEEPRDYEVVCFHPEPETTAGEARAVGDLARGGGWQELLVVTSDDHVARARILLRQCTDAQVRMVPVERSLNPGAVMREWLGIIGGVTVARAC